MLCILLTSLSAVLSWASSPRKASSCIAGAMVPGRCCHKNTHSAPTTTPAKPDGIPIICFFLNMLGAQQISKNSGNKHQNLFIWRTWICKASKTYFQHTDVLDLRTMNTCSLNLNVLCEEQCAEIPEINKSNVKILRQVLVMLIKQKHGRVHDSQ